MDADPVTPPNRWLTEAGTSFGPAAGGRAASYDDRWEQLAAQGEQVHGEADLVESLCPPRSGRPRVLDAGCGTGRVGIELARRGLDVTGVDIDPTMLARARAKAPDLMWVETDLVDVDLGRTFDIVVAAGNVMIYLAPGTEGGVVSAFARHLGPEGLLVAGFQLDAGAPHLHGAGRLDLATYDAHAAAAGLVLSQRWATWDRQAYAGGPYAVSVHHRVG